MTGAGPQAPPPGARAMAVVRWVLVVATAVVALFSVLGHAGVRGGPGKGGASGQPYYCPMHPSVVQDHRGECPICSMTLVPRPASTAPKPRSAGGVSGLAAVDLTPERVQLIGMRTAVARRERLDGDLSALGTVAVNERGLAQVTTRFGGWVERLLVAQTGERVRRGQVLAMVYGPDVLRAEQELLVMRGWSDAGASNVQADARRRLALLGVSDRELDELLRTGRAPETVAVPSPADGYVVTRNAVPGLAVQPGTVLFEVADLSTVWVTADVHEQDASRIHVGQRARLELAAYPGQAHEGKVQLIYPLVDPQSRTLRIRVELRNRFDRGGPLLKPGMTGTVHLDLPSQSGLVVPAEALVDTGDSRYVFVVKDGGHFEPRAVRVGARVKDRVEILSGVADGETVVTTGNFLVDSESRLRAAVEGQ